MSTNRNRNQPEVKIPDRLRILVAEDEFLIGMSLKAQLENLGYEVVAVAENGVRAVELARALAPDLAILDIKMPVMDGLTAAKQILDERPLPILLLTAYSDDEYINKAVEVGASGYLVKPVTEADLMPAIRLAAARFHELQLLAEEVGNLTKALETRKLVEQAKGILMQRLKLTEAEAFRRIQTQSQNDNKPMADIAKAIITADKMFAEAGREGAA
jgi:response regulator NasT